MRSPPSLLVVCALLLTYTGAVEPLAGQSTVTGIFSGTVLDERGVALSRALVSLSPVGSDAARSVDTGSDGRFAIPQLAPGSYEVRIEAVGYRPLVARGLTIGGGGARDLTFRLTTATPPVTAVDTMFVSGASSLVSASDRGVLLDTRTLSRLPHRFGDLAWIASLTSAFDESLGAQGLPGDLTALVVDGIPVHRAPHPVARSEARPTGLLTAASLASVSALGAATDVEWSGGVGGYLVAATPSSSPAGGLSFDAAYSGDATWSSSELDLTTPSLNSFEGSLLGGGGSENGTRAVFAADALRHQTPIVPRGSEALVEGLTGVTPELMASLSTPSVETYARYSGLARLDFRRGDATAVFFRGVGSLVQREYDGAGPISLAPSAAPPEKSFDMSIGGGVVSRYSDALTLELRGGFSGSFRDFDPTDADVVSAYLSGPAVAFGDAAAATGSSSRTDLVLIPVVHLQAGSGRVKVGGSVRTSKHTMTHAPASEGQLVFTDVDALNAGTGFAHLSTAGEMSFSTQEFGAFAQYSIAPAQGLELTLGGRFDHERIPSGDVDQNVPWLAASGVNNADFPDAFDQLGARASMAWEPSPTAGTRVTAYVSVDRGDIDTRAVYEVLSQNSDPTTTWYAGSGLSWPQGEVPSGAPVRPNITMFGPAVRPPRTVVYGAGLSQRVGPGLSVHLAGSFRRTDFLMRRRNLNLPIVPLASDPAGRPIHGTLQKLGGVVVTTAPEARRFPGFAEAWALDPDGWSKYRGLTGGVTYGGGPVELFASYTYSETTDNWVGASSGLPEAMLPPGLSASAVDGEWTEGTSDFDVPHRVAGGARAAFGVATLSATYRYRSGLPFTPGYRYGVDVNGDGSLRNDVAFVPGDSQLAVLLDSWPCLEEQADGFAARNSCRGPASHQVDVGLEIGLGNVGGREAIIRLDALDLVEERGGVLDDALWVVDPATDLTTSADGQTVTIPMTINPAFGSVVYPSSRGRMLRLGVRIGG